MNNSTTLTLNDRFSMIKTNTNGFPQRARSGSRSRGRQQPANLRGSTRNRRLLDQLEKQHKMRLALKLKNKSILRSRGRAQGQIVRNSVKRAATIKKAVNVRNLKRTNNLTTFVPLNDGPRRNFRGRSRSRSQSRNRVQPTGTIADRLGTRMPPRRRRGGQAIANGAPPQRSRSQPSRVRLNRNNFNNRNGNVNNRNGSVNNRNRSVNNRNGNFNNQSAPLKRSNSVNARLGNAGPAQTRRRRRFASNTRNPNTQLNKPIGGRIVKRNPRNAGPAGPRVQRSLRKNANQFGGNALANGRPRKIIKRGNNVQAQARGRARNRAPGNQAGQGAAGRRGRSRTKRVVNNNRGGAGGNVSKAQLDKQLDDYMSKGSA